MTPKAVNLHHKEVKKLIRSGSLADPFFLNVSSFSPYSSCQHGCVYCDGRAEKYHLEGSFERDITVRDNTIPLLSKELTKLRERSPISIGSGITDVYQPIEAEVGIMRSVAKELTKHHFPISVLTKSSLITRDIDLWEQVHRKNQFHLQISITTLDDSIRERFEPGASPMEERLETIKAFKAIGCPVGIFMMPLLPGITDEEENLIPLLTKLKELEVDFVMPGFLTLRPGRQKDFYIATIKRHYPKLLPLYEELFRKPLVSGSPSYEYRTQYKKRYQHLYTGINIEAPHRVFKGHTPVYQELHLLLSHMKSLYRRRGIDVAPLSDAYKRYVSWVEEEKRIFNRKRSLHCDAIDEKLTFMLQCGGFESILQNEKLLQFMQKVVLEKQLFDYQSLTLQRPVD